MIVGIDASRNRSGGAKGHLVGILGEANPEQHRIREIHVWTNRALAEALPKRNWLKVHQPAALERSLIHQIAWQRLRFHQEARNVGCDIVLNTDGGTVSRFRPCVTMSRDMTYFEPGVISRFGWGKARLRLEVLRRIQSHNFRTSDGVIFLTRYAAKIIQASIGPIEHIAYIPHGLGAEFKSIRSNRCWITNETRAVKCIYVSHTEMYKHQWEVVRAFGQLRDENFNVKLTLVGGGAGQAQRLLDKTVDEIDPEGVLIENIGAVSSAEIPKLLADADIFVFASSCENLPNTLLEAMAAGLPIVCSDRGPMPEILKDGGIYFNPESPSMIADAVKQVLLRKEIREEIIYNAKNLSSQYSWARCANETLSFLVNTFESVDSNKSSEYGAV